MLGSSVEEILNVVSMLFGMWEDNRMDMVFYTRAKKMGENILIWSVMAFGLGFFAVIGYGLFAAINLKDFWGVELIENILLVYMMLVWLMLVGYSLIHNTRAGVWVGRILKNDRFYTLTILCIILLAFFPTNVLVLEKQQSDTEISMTVLLLAIILCCMQASVLNTYKNFFRQINKINYYFFDKNNLKIYIHYATDKEWVLCSTEKDVEDSKSIRYVQIEEIKGKKEIFFEKECLIPERVNKSLKRSKNKEKPGVNSAKSDICK